MSKFTKGEWVYDEFSAIVKTVSNNSRPICIVIEEGEDDYSEEDDTNGRLIAAAPEMYKLLTAVANYKPDIIWDVVFHAKELLLRIDGEEAKHE